MPMCTRVVSVGHPLGHEQPAMATFPKGKWLSLSQKPSTSTANSFLQLPRAPPLRPRHIHAALLPGLTLCRSCAAHHRWKGAQVRDLTDVSWMPSQCVCTGSPSHSFPRAVECGQGCPVQIRSNTIEAEWMLWATGVLITGNRLTWTVPWNWYHSLIIPLYQSVDSSTCEACKALALLRLAAVQVVKSLEQRQLRIPLPKTRRNRRTVRMILPQETPEN